MGGLTRIRSFRKKVRRAYLYCGKPFAIIRRLFGGIAQLGERLHGMQEVSGSIPLTSTKEMGSDPVLGSDPSFLR